MPPSKSVKIRNVIPVEAGKVLLRDMRLVPGKEGLGLVPAYEWYGLPPQGLLTLPRDRVVGDIRHRFAAVLSEKIDGANLYLDVVRYADGEFLPADIRPVELEEVEGVVTAVRKVRHFSAYLTGATVVETRRKSFSRGIPLSPKRCKAPVGGRAPFDYDSFVGPFDLKPIRSAVAYSLGLRKGLPSAETR